MQQHLLKKGLGVAAAFCLIAAVLSSKLDWHWSVRLALWGLGIAGLVWASWDKAMPQLRDETTRASQPGLYEGSQFEGGAGGDGSGS